MTFSFHLSIYFLIAFYPSNILVTLAVWIVIIAALFAFICSMILKKIELHNFRNYESLDLFDIVIENPNIVSLNSFMDLESKNAYRSKVQDIAKDFEISELHVAKKCVLLILCIYRYPA